MSAEGEVMSKGAKKRAAKKANKAAAEEEVVAPTPAVPKANQAKAKPAEKPASPPQVAPKPEAKSKAKAAPKPETKPEAAPPAKPAKETKPVKNSAPTTQNDVGDGWEMATGKKEKKKQAQNQQAGGAPKGQPQASADQVRRKEELGDFSAFYQEDDGSGEAWEVKAGSSSKYAEKKKKQEGEKGKVEQQKEATPAKPVRRQPEKTGAGNQPVSTGKTLGSVQALLDEAAAKIAEIEREREAAMNRPKGEKRERHEKKDKHENHDAEPAAEQQNEEEGTKTEGTKTEGTKTAPAKEGKGGGGKGGKKQSQNQE